MNVAFIIKTRKMISKKNSTIKIVDNSGKWSTSYTAWNPDAITELNKVFFDPSFTGKKVWVAGNTSTKSSSVTKLHKDFITIYTEGSGTSNLLYSQVIVHPSEFVTKKRKQRRKKN
jgi:hypothetical protein